MAPKQAPRRGAKSRATARPIPADNAPPFERRTKRRHDPAEQPGPSSASPSSAKRGTNIYCKGGVDTPHTGVDTMFQALRQKMKKWSTSVDTRPGQVDTRDRSQRNMLTGFYLRSTLNYIVSTLESLPRRPVFQMSKAGRHEMISGRH
ncbi:hypothetical protein Taro_003715 [Colocasia esculenta]|uniref:Uncharacterized protein n=1 Tax=Colocasia esculenta TaxID=4460 RepID=A0A843TSN5_COLES|nr:hypothetical protein [Colocasia esculenta]